MKKITLLFFVFNSIFFGHFSYSQNYIPFSTTTANWDLLCWAQWGPTDILLVNYIYVMSGDTVINGKQYKKIYYRDDWANPQQYIGGLREDTLRQIFFFPGSNGITSYTPITFPSDTTEQLLYTFNNLSVGTVLPINTGNTIITVVGIDSVLLGSIYHKRYEVQNQNLLFPPEYWIEGIGSTKELFSAYTYEFEWTLYTLCYEDSMSYYLNAPNGADSCHYYSGLNEFSNDKLFKAYPNPVIDNITIETYTNLDIEISNIEGQII